MVAGKAWATMLHRESDVCKCGHSAMVHVGKCWGKTTVAILGANKTKDCVCQKFEKRVVA